MNKNHKNKSLIKKLLKHNLRITSRNMHPHEFQQLDLILNNLNCFIVNSPTAEITDNIIRLRGKLERLVGVLYRNPTIFNLSAEVAANNVYRLGYSVLKQHLSKSPEIEEIWKLIESSFSKPSSPELFTCASSSTSSSLSGVDETEPETPHNVNPSTSKETVSVAVTKEVEESKLEEVGAKKRKVTESEVTTLEVVY